MKVSEFLNLLGEELTCKFNFSWFIEDGTEVSVETDFIECAYELFGDKTMCETSAIYFYKKDDDILLQIYLQHKD